MTKLSRNRRKWTAIISTGAALWLCLATPASAELKTEFDSFTVYGVDCDPLHTLDDPDKGNPRQTVREAVSYWNAVTKNRLNMTITYGEFTHEGQLYTGFSGQVKGQEVIAYNMYFDNLVLGGKDYSFVYTMPGQILYGTGIDFFSLTSHEIAHSLGIKLDRDDNRIYPMDGLKWGDLVRDTEGNGINGLWISPGDDPTGAETFTEKVSRGVRYVFTGPEAAAVYGDAWMGGTRAAVPLPVEATYQFKDNEFHWGSSLLHPYTRFGNMNAVIASSKRPFFNEAELAVFYDLGQPVDIKGQFGRSVYTSDNKVTNSDTFSSANLYGIGLHIVGDRNTITQTGSLNADGEEGAGIRIEGMDNQVLIGAGTTVSANGENGKGVLISHGDGAHLVNLGTIEATGNSGVGVYLNSGTWSDEYWTVTNGKARQFDNAGVINAKRNDATSNDAIRLAGSLNDMTINFMNGSSVIGHITAETGSKATLIFGKNANSDGTASAELNPGAVMAMTGNINGGDGIAMEVLAGTFTQTGSSTVAAATAGPGAVWNINGDLVNHGQFGLAANGNQSGTITVSGQADIHNSKIVSTAGSVYIPGKSYTILEATGAGSIQGTVVDGAFTGLLNVTALNDGKKVTVTTAIGDNLGPRTATQQGVHLLMKDMYSSTHSPDMYRLFSLDSAATKEALDQIAGAGPLSMAALIQGSTVAEQAIAARMTGVKNTYLLGAAIDTNAGQEKSHIPTDVILLDNRPDSNWWLKFGKSWNKVGGDYNSHSSSFVIGGDYQRSGNQRQGLFLSYGKNSGADSLTKTDNNDIRIGLYRGGQQDGRDWHLYADYGWQNSTALRYLPALDRKSDSHYHSRVIEVGGMYKYDLHYGTQRTWHTSPYIKIQAVRYMQDGYREQGAGLFDRQVSPMDNHYIAGQVGVEFSRQGKQGGVALNAGYKHVFTGYEPSVIAAFAGNPGSTCTVVGDRMDRDLLVLGIAGWQQMKGDWLLDGKVEMEKGANDTHLRGEIMLKHRW